jgi:DNA-binding NtrC family response regulator
MASNGEEALNVLAREHLDLALLDIIMPGMSGTDLFHRMQASHPEVAVVFVTAMADVELAVGSLKSGAYDYVTKPMKFRELGEVVRRALDRKRTQREDDDRKASLRQLVDVKTDEALSSANEVSALNRSFRTYLDRQLSLDEIAKNMAQLAESAAADLTRLADIARRLGDGPMEGRDPSPRSIRA